MKKFGFSIPPVVLTDLSIILGSCLPVSACLTFPDLLLVFLLVFLCSLTDLCMVRFCLSLLIFVARVWPSVQSPVGPSLLAVQAPNTAFQSQFLRCCFAYAATVPVWSTSEIRHPHRSSPVVIFHLHALASGLVGVFTPKRAAQTKLKFLFSFLLRWLCLGISECWLALLI
jgi:hypothetical protein